MTPSELDQLADYAEGLLDGTPDGDRIAGRIAHDQEWADAYRQLTASLPGLTTALGELGDAPMPADVAARLDRALAAEPPLKTTESDEDGPAGTWTTPEPADRLSAQRERRKRAATAGRWAAAAAAVAVLALCGIGVVRSNSMNGDDSATTSAADSGSRPSVMSVPAGDSVVHVSGTSYSERELGPQARAMLSGPAAAEAPREAGPTASTKAVPGPQPSGSPVPAALTRLTDPAQLAACLTALGLGRPIAVDYATLEGSPAVVIVTADADPGRFAVVAAGADCGVGGAGDERARTTVAR